MIGQTFNRLTVLRPSTKRHKHRGPFWICQCICGNECTVRSDGLRNGHAKSCGCLQRETAKKLASEKILHGDSRRGKRSKEFRSYCSAKDRCTNPKDTSWPRYGGRGIKFLFTSFEEFLSCIGRRPSQSHTLDRIRNDGHYEPGNIRWATKSEQAFNRRHTELALKAQRRNMLHARKFLKGSQRQAP